MGRSPCCSKVGLRRGPWSSKEDSLLSNFIQQNGEGQWRSLPKKAGLLRCGKSCRLRWMNYLRPGIKRGNISEDEEDLIVRLHGLLGNRWSLIAGRLPGRTDNEIKNYWNTHLLKKLQSKGININQQTHKNLSLPKPTKTKKPTASASAAVGKKKKKAKNAAPVAEVVKMQTDERVNGGGGSSHSHEEKKNDETDLPKTKVYLPKPIRVSPAFSRSGSYDSLASGASSSEGVGDAAEKAAELVSYVPVAWPPLFELDDEGYCGGEDDFLDGGFILPMLQCRPDSVSSDVDLLEQVYDEYLQLL